jgi:4-phytase/acid phosphatase
MSDTMSARERRSELLQVTLLSRHGVRAPLTEELGYLEPFVDLPWPGWETAPAMLTEHGGRLAAYLGAWYAERYRDRLDTGGREPGDWIYLRADSLERCVQTAERWLAGFLAQHEPAVPVHHLPLEEPTRYDPLFLPIDSGMVQIHGLDEAIAGRIGGSLWHAIESLSGPLSRLQEALGGPVFSPEIYGEPNTITPDGDIRGTLKLAQFAADIFVLQHANGWPIEKVAWGRLDRKGLLDIERARIFTDNLANRSTAYARGGASYLMAQILAGMAQCVSGRRIGGLPFSPATRLVGYFGHDTNIQTLGGLLNLSWVPASFVMNQAPPACALVFELHRDEDSGEHFVRLWFVTATLEQMYQGTLLSAATPPSCGPLGLAHERGLRTSLDIPFDELERIVRAAVDPEAVGDELAAWLRDQ